MTAIKSQLGRVILISCMALLSGRVTLWASDDQLIAGAKKEGEVSLYLSTNLTDANGMIVASRRVELNEDLAAELADWVEEFAA